jgi:predicted lysophospholipase L1 biosynthesis ABC-type transport system permease subunit
MRTKEQWREMRRRSGLAVLLAVGVTAAGCSSPKTLRSGDVQEQIASSLSEQVGGDFSVTCPTGVPAQEGATFACTATDAADGTTVTIAVTASDDAGGFAWTVRAPSATATPTASAS